MPAGSMETEELQFLRFQATGRQHRGCIIPQAVTHGLVLLKMGRIIARKHVELNGIINKPLLLHLVGCLYYLHQWCTVKKIPNSGRYFWYF